MKTEFERLSGRQPMDTLSMKRYELPTPPPGKMTDVQVHNLILIRFWIRICSYPHIHILGVDRMRGEQRGAAGAPEDKDHEPRSDARLWRRELETV